MEMIDKKVLKEIISKIVANQKRASSYLSSERHLLMDSDLTAQEVVEIFDEYDIPMIAVDVRKISLFNPGAHYWSDVLSDLVNVAGGNIRKAEKGVVVLDHFENLCLPEKTDMPSITITCSEFQELWGVALSKEEMEKQIEKCGKSLMGDYGYHQYYCRQKDLIPYLRGTLASVTWWFRGHSFDTSKLTFICLGHFDNIRDKVNAGATIPGVAQDYIDEGLLPGLVDSFSFHPAYKIQHLKKKEDKPKQMN